MPAATAEDDLIIRVGTGDRDAFEALVAGTRDGLYRYLRSLVQSDQLAEDALQEVYLGVWRGANAFTGAASGRVWLYALARRQAARTWRRRAGQPRDAAPLETLAVAAGYGCASQAPFDEVDAHQAIGQGLARLDDDDREVIVLRDLLGFTGPEAASLVELDLAALKSRLHRARLRLMAVLREPDDLGGSDG